jgi:hypothetical protein
MDSTAPRNDDDFEAAFEQRPVLGQFVVERFLVNELLRVVCQTDGDVESMMIWSVLGLQATAAELVTHGRPLPRAPAGSTLPESVIRGNGLRSSDLAQITGIPRETVRRKLERMQAKGRVQRHENGRWHTVDAAMAPELRQLARSTARHLCETADQLRAALRD